MPFVKLDCGILRSTLWFDRGSRDVFLTALLMAEPAEFDQPIKTYDPNTGAEVGYVVPAGAYGFVEASGPGLIRYSLAEPEEGKKALVRLCSPEPESRTPDFEGRRMVRINDGFLILNYAKYREKDYTAADRMRRYRERIKASDAVTSRGDAVTIRSVTQAEAYAEAEAEAEAKPLVVRESADRFVPPSVEEVKAYASEKGLPINADYFVDFFEAKGWITGKSKMRSWRAAVRNAAREGWTIRGAANPTTDAPPKGRTPSGDYRLPTGGYAAADGSWFDYKGTRFFEQKPGVYRDEEGYAPDGTHKQNTSYGPAAKEIADKILAPTKAKP